MARRPPFPESPDPTTLAAALGKGADPNAVDMFGTPYLSCFAGDGDAELVRILLDHGADPCPPDGASLVVALMRGHGNLVVASDIQRVVHRALYTEVNAQQLATALSFRRPIKYVTEDEAQDPKRLGDSWDVWKAEAMGKE